MNQLVDDHRYEELRKETTEHDPTYQYEPLRVHPGGNSQLQGQAYQSSSFSEFPEDKSIYVNTLSKSNTDYEVAEHVNRPKYENLEEVERSGTQAPQEEGST